jgi:hypothetical protein
LIVLGNLESFNSEMIKNGIEQKERIKQLQKIAREQLSSLLKDKKQIKK